MNFTTFEACEPGEPGVNCESDSSDWNSAYSLVKDQQYLYRMNVTNNGVYDIFLELRSSLIMLPVKDDGGNANKVPFFIRADSTPTNEDPGAYTDNTKNLAAGVSVTVYFGSVKAGQTTIEKVFNGDGIIAVFLLVFGHEDTDQNGYQITDPPYSQNMPFQGLVTG